MRTCAAAVLLAIGVPAMAAIGITCSSERGGRVYCPADTGGEVLLVRPISAAVCRKGYSWGYDGSGVWVDHGCKADFTVPALGLLGSLLQNPKGYSAAQPLQCAATAEKRHYCQADTRGGVRLLADSKNCLYGKSWGYDAGGVWVQHGCEANFELGGAAAYRPPEVPGVGHLWGGDYGFKSFTCASDNGQRKTCEADTGQGAVLMKDLSGSVCQRGVTWGIERHAVWVDQGCRGEFQTVLRYTP